MKKELPKIKKDISDFSPSLRDLVHRIQCVGSTALVAALGLLGLNADTTKISSSDSAQPTTSPTITNRKDKTEASTLVLEQARTDQNQQSLLAHRSHSSHSSHRSHYSSAGGGTTTTSVKPTENTWQNEDQLLVGTQRLTGIITEVQSEKEYFILKDETNNLHTIYYKDTTRVRVTSPKDQTTTIETLKAFTGSLPLKVGKSVLVHWKTQESKKVAMLITFFEL